MTILPKRSIHAALVSLGVLALGATCGSTSPDVAEAETRGRAAAQSARPEPIVEDEANDAGDDRRQTVQHAPLEALACESDPAHPMPTLETLEFEPRAMTLAKIVAWSRGLTCASEHAGFLEVLADLRPARRGVVVGDRGWAVIRAWMTSRGLDCIGDGGDFVDPERFHEHCRSDETNGLRVPSFGGRVRDYVIARYVIEYVGTVLHLEYDLRIWSRLGGPLLLSAFDEWSPEVEAMMASYRARWSDEALARAREGLRATSAELRWASRELPDANPENYRYELVRDIHALRISSRGPNLTLANTALAELRRIYERVAEDPPRPRFLPRRR